MKWIDKKKKWIYLALTSFCFVVAAGGNSILMITLTEKDVHPYILALIAPMPLILSAILTAVIIKKTILEFLK